MADNGKKKSKGGKPKAAEEKANGEGSHAADDAAEAKAEAKPETLKEKLAEHVPKDQPVGPDVHADGHGAAHPHTHAPNRKEYAVIFGVLLVLTILEVAITKLPGIAKTPMSMTLIALALVKAACVALYFMHLKMESKVLKLTVALPLAAPAIYAVVLISEAWWRLARW